MSPRAIEKHPRAIRWCHWINFPLIALMIWSGILIYWANDIYIKIPEPLAVKLGVSHRLAEGMGWHFFLMWFFVLNGAVYLVYLLASGEWRELVPGRDSLNEAIEVTLRDFHLRRAPPIIRGKFNGAQRFAYTGVLLLAFGSVLTGLAIYKPVQLRWLAACFGGYEGARWVHFILMIGLVLFFIVHVLQVLRAGWNCFRSMISGYELVAAEEEGSCQPRKKSNLKN